MPSISRRTLLQGTGAMAVVGSLSGLIPETAHAMNSLGAKPELLNKRAGTVKYHSCLRNCADRCLMKFRVQDGRMTYVSGAEKQAKTGTCPCVKGLTYVEYTYAPDRILHPMERIGEKGSHKWRRITWEEAWAKLITKTKEVVAKYGPEAVLPYSYSGNYGAIGMHASGERFFNRLGASYLDRLVCTEAGVWGYGSVQGTTDGPDPDEIPNCDCYISWGFNETVSNVHGIKLINQMRDKGGVVLAVNPNRTPICSQADVYLQNYPGSDAWVATGVMKYLIAHDETIDHEFLDKCCIGADKVFEKVNSVKWEDIERVTGCKRAEIEKFAALYGKSKNCIIRGGYGMQRNYNGARMTRAIAIMHALRGMFDRPNAGIIYDNVRSITGMNNFDGRGNYFLTGKEQHVNMTDLDQALKAKNPTSQNLIDNHTTPPQPIKPIHLFFFYNGNPVAVSPNVNQVIENLKRDDLYVVGFDMIMTDSMEYCDLVLPASTQFETDDIIGDYHGWFLQICEKVIEPVGESMPNWDFFAEWGRRMGFKDQAFKDTSFDIMRQLLNTKAPWYQGITLERLQKEKWIKLPYPSSVPVRSGGKCGTESGKIELYSEMMKRAGFDPVIDLGLCEDDMPEVEKKLPFRLLSPGIPQRVNSSFYNVKYIRAFNAYECEISPEDAQKLGIKMGDRVRLTNQRGEAYFIARVSTRVGPGVVRTAKCNWRSTNPYGKNNTNTLTTSRLTDMGGCSAYHSTRVNVEKA
ncbi:twin-arginine translocation pathway signal protein [Sutterella sp. AM11-39]|jgi:anaerobic selenocysteine-containing dehydrogenase|uniref:molybdopterin-containing oxidoreductase family protein n=1 Tax=Sutterella sp. AM11-39 TaxID=2292075 RepID=UPI000E50CC65|nr:molybdopterin-dependent oxidoreductase [Sutterella sp. AM11-39]RHJ32165.1 twin-arginine translocation pathway signal protein [Sutterella sp. AM11-39]